MKIAVLGGGVIGLTTAAMLQEEIPNIDITLIASDFANTTSHVAAGIFRVGSSYSGPNEKLTRDWIKYSYDYYDNIKKKTDSSSSGVKDISGYIFSKNSLKIVENHWMQGLVPIYRPAIEEEFDLVQGEWKYGSYYQTLLTDCGIYLPWLTNKLKRNGVKFQERTLNTLGDLGVDYDYAMNCTGLGAREMCKDYRLVSIRGQVLKIKAPWIKFFFYGELDTYIIPGFDGSVTLGGSRSYDSENLQPCPYERAAILERCTNLLPSIKETNIVKEKIGLRPHRENNIRVEAEFLSNGLSNLKVVHNYGHGGYGVCTAPGTVNYAVKLLKDMHKSSVAKL
ncbi:D-aspartate oxidase isoform X2 [Prorops nasuta]|uniref:D-aspartate oxidase isoform X2 n=1 Tax=Prorops nasuta TaxID=863751 RepID=UPI0034CDB041